MARPRPWIVLSHTPIHRFENNLWEVEGDTPGIPVPRRMVIIRLTTGDLVIHNPVALGDEAMAEIEAFGKPAYLVIPSHLHGLDADPFKARYPEIRVLAPAAKRAKVEKKHHVDGSFEDLPEDPSLRGETIDGGKLGEAAFIATAPDGGVTVIFNDMVFNLPKRLKGFKGFVIRMLGSTGGPKVTWLGRRLAVRDAQACADHLRRLAALPGLRRVIPGHGAVIEEDAPGVLDRVAGRLRPPRE